MEQKFKPGFYYYIDGNSLNGFLSIADKLCSGDRIKDFARRDMGQWIQARCNNCIPVEDEVEK
jgi:hypothetical protein